MADSSTPTANIHSFDLSVSNSTAIGSQSNSAGAGKVNFSDVTIAKASDSTSVVLFNALTAGTEIPSATVTLYQPGNTDTALSYTFKVVYVTSQETSVTSASDTPLDTVTFEVGSIELSSGGSNPVSGRWDQVTNTSSCAPVTTC
jgi:type VI protein secretion system component Hcp